MAAPRAARTDLVRNATQRCRPGTQPLCGTHALRDRFHQANHQFTSGARVSLRTMSALHEPRTVLLRSAFDSFAPVVTRHSDGAPHCSACMPAASVDQRGELARQSLGFAKSSDCCVRR